VIDGPSSLLVSPPHATTAEQMYYVTGFCISPNTTWAQIRGRKTMTTQPLFSLSSASSTIIASSSRSIVPSSLPLVNLCSKLPRKGREPMVVVVVTELNAVGCSLMCPGLGSSNSSTSPSAFCPNESAGTTPSELAALRVNGDGGGLRDFDRRASSCKKGMGENRGVAGTVDGVGYIETVARSAGVPDSFSGGKASQDDVTSNDFSTARRYLPTVL
jgi:hypothetical protein